MSIPLYRINSMTYSGGTISINVDYSNFLGGGSVSIVGFPTGATLSYNNSFGLNSTYSFAFSLSASTTYNLTFSYVKSPYINYPINTPQFIGITGGSSLEDGGYPYITEIYNPGGLETLYQINRIITTFRFTT
jgi:hypothetical protein